MTCDNVALTGAERARVAALIARRLPADAPFATPRPDDMSSLADARVDWPFLLTIDMGDAGLLSLWAPAWMVEDGRKDDFGRLVELILDRIAEATRHRERIAYRLARVEALAAREVERMGHGLRLVRVGLAPARVDEKIRPADRLETRYEDWDEHFRPRAQRVEARTSRELVKGIRCALPWQRKLFGVKARLEEPGLALEVTATADNAIGLAGSSVADVMRSLAAGSRSIALEIPGQEDAVTIYLRDGRISACGRLCAQAYLNDDEIKLPLDLPATALKGMRGGPASRLLDHPVLQGAVSIRRGAARNGGRDILLAMGVRGVTAAELGAPALS